VRQPNLLRQLKGLFLLLLAGMTLQSCVPAGYVTYIIYNHSGSQLSFADCNKNITIIQRDGTKEIRGFVGFSGDNLDCFRKRELVFVRDVGSTWRYKLWDHRDVRNRLGREARKARERELAAFVAPPAHPTARVNPLRTTIVPLVIGRNGAIQPVRWEAYDDVADPNTPWLYVFLVDGLLHYKDRFDSDAVLMKARPFFSDAGIPAGFPIDPIVGTPKQ
jgi:hypothetical protein